MRKLLPLTTPQYPWSHVTLNFLTDLPKFQGNTVILTVMDHFSKSIRLIPLPSLPSAFDVAKTMFLHTLVFQKILSVIVDVELGSDSQITSGYLLQANVKQVNKEVGKFLRMHCANHQTDWARFLPWADYNQNSLYPSATKFTPLPVTCVIQWNPSSMESPAIDEWIHQSEQVWEEAH